MSVIRNQTQKLSSPIVATTSAVVASARPSMTMSLDVIMITIEPIILHVDGRNIHISKLGKLKTYSPLPSKSPKIPTIFRGLDCEKNKD